MMRVVRHGNRLSREVLDVLSLEVFKARSAGALSNLFCWKVFRPMVGGLEVGDPQVPSNPNYLMINEISSPVPLARHYERSCRRSRSELFPLEGREAGSCHCWAAVRPQCLCLTASSAPSLKQHLCCTMQLVPLKQFQ